MDPSQKDATMTLANLAALGINTNTLARFANLAAAHAFALTFNDIRLVVQGCDGRFWVVSARDAGRLRGMGYEVV
jgi:hypothetical protein